MEPKSDHNDIVSEGCLFSGILLGLPLFFIFFILISKWNDIIHDLFSLSLLGALFLIYTGILIAFFHQSKSAASNQGYSLFIFLLLIALFLIMFVELIINDLNPIYSTMESFIETIQLVNSFMIVAFFLYSGSYFIQVILILIYGLLHKTATELRYNSDISLKIEINKNENLNNDFSFATFNRYLKVQFIWVIIPLVTFPISINFKNISDIDSFSYLLVSIIIIVLLLSVQLGLIHYRNFKQKITFVLIENIAKTNEKQVGKEISKKYFADDLISFLKIGLVIGLTGRLLDLINLFNRGDIGTDIILMALIFGCFFSLIYLTEIIYLFFLQYCHNYVSNHEKTQKYFNKLWRLPRKLLSETINRLKVIDNKITKKRLEFRQKSINLKRKILFPLVYLFSIFLEVFLAYIGLIVIIFEIIVILSVIGFILLVSLYITIISFPLVLVGSGLIYYSTQKE